MTQSFRTPGSSGAMTLAMRAAVSPNARKTLRVALVIDGVVREERLLLHNAPLTLGSTERNTFVVSGDAMPRHHTLFAHDGSAWTLHTPAGMSGRLAQVDGVKSIDSNMTVQLDPGSRGRLELGNVRLMFQFVLEPREQPKAQLPVVLRSRLGAHLDGRYNACLAFFLAAGVASLGYVEYAYDPEISTDDDIGRIVRLLPPEPEEPKIAIAPKVTDTTKTPAPSQPGTQQQPLTPSTSTTNPTRVASNQASQPTGSRVTPRDTGAQDREDADRAARDAAQAIADLERLESATVHTITGIGGTGDPLHTAALDRGNMPDTQLALQQVPGVTQNPDGSNNVAIRTGTAIDPDGSQLTSNGTPTGPSQTTPNTNVTTPVVAIVHRPVRVEGDPVEAETDTGAIDPAGVNRQINARLTAIRTCYEQYIRLHPNDEGTVSLRFNVCSTGGVGRVRSATGSGLEQVGRCVSNVVRSITFKDPGESMCVDFSRNFNFHL